MFTFTRCLKENILRINISNNDDNDNDNNNDNDNDNDNVGYTLYYMWWDTLKAWISKVCFKKEIQK